MGYNPTNMKLSRIARHLKQKELARLLNITQEAYSRKETGVSNFTLSEANKIRIGLKLSENEVLNIFFKD